MVPAALYGGDTGGGIPTSGWRSGHPHFESLRPFYSDRFLLLPGTQSIPSIEQEFPIVRAN